MVVSNTIFSNLFGGHNVKPKSANTEKQTFKIDPDADIVDATFTVLDERKPFIYTRNSQNNHGNSEGFFTQRDNLDFSKSAPFSQVATANIAQSYYVSDRSFATGSTKYGSSGSSSLSSSNKEAAQVGRQLAFNA